MMKFCQENRFLFTQQQSSSDLNWHNYFSKQHTEHHDPKLASTFYHEPLIACLPVTQLFLNVISLKKNPFSKRRKETHFNQTLTTTQNHITCRFSFSLLP
jgi:hypothetical protein